MKNIFGALFGWHLRAENRQLRERNADLHSQLQTHRQSRTLSPEEDKAIADLREQFRVQNEEVNAIAMWLRRNKQKEIDQGRHTGLKFSEVVIMYLAKGLDK